MFKYYLPDGLWKSTLDTNKPIKHNNIGHNISIKNPLTSFIVIRYLRLKHALKSFINLDFY